MKALDWRSVRGQSPDSPWLDDDATTRLCCAVAGPFPLDSTSGDPALNGSLERFKSAPLYWKTALEQAHWTLFQKADLDLKLGFQVSEKKGPLRLEDPLVSLVLPRRVSYFGTTPYKIE